MLLQLTEEAPLLVFQSLLCSLLRTEVQKNDMKQDIVIRMDIQCDSMPCGTVGTSCEQNLEIFWCDSGHTGLHNLTPLTIGTDLITTLIGSAMRCMCICQKRKAWFQAIRSWHPFAPVRSSNGDVSCQHSSLHHHAHWQMVK